jgi:elongation factor 3
MKMAHCTYTYPANSEPTVKDVSVQVQPHTQFKP